MRVENRGIEPVSCSISGRSDHRATRSMTLLSLSGEELNLRPPLYQSGALDQLAPDNCTPCGTRTRSSALKGQETNPYPNGA